MGRIDRRKKKKKLSIWVKILIVIVLFIIAGFSGYIMGDIAGNQSAKEAQNQLAKERAQQEKQKNKVIHYKVDQVIPIDDTIDVKIKKCETYPNIKGPKYPLGITVEVINKSNKEQELPFKYLFKLTLGDKSLAQSVGIYSLEDIKQQMLVSEMTKLKKKEKRTVVYLFSAKNKKEYTSKNATLNINTPSGQRRLSLKVIQAKGTTKVSESTTSSSVVQPATTSTTYEQTTQMEATVNQSTVQTVQSTQQTQAIEQTQQASIVQQQQIQQTQAVISQGQMPVVNAGQQVNNQGGFVQ